MHTTHKHDPCHGPDETHCSCSDTHVHAIDSFICSRPADKPRSRADRGVEKLNFVAMRTDPPANASRASPSRLPAPWQAALPTATNSTAALAPVRRKERGEVCPGNLTVTACHETDAGRDLPIPTLVPDGIWQSRKRSTLHFLMVEASHNYCVKSGLPRQ